MMADAEEVVGGTMQVLLVEDQDSVRETLAELLADAGLDVGEAASGEQALDMVAAGGPPDVVVTDLDLGSGLSGLVLGERLAATWPEIGVVYITGRPWLIQDHRLGPRERFLQKPCSSARLIDAIEAVHEH
ncbi:MAG: response regulator [Acetobacteraceae bacterium]